MADPTYMETLIALGDVVSYWPLDDAVGATVIDDAVGPYDGVLGGSGSVLFGQPPVLTEGGTSARSSGTRRIIVNGYKSFDGRAPFTVIQWIRPEATAGMTPMSRRAVAGTSTSDGWALAINGTGRCNFQRVAGGVVLNSLTDASLPIKLSAAAMIAGVYDGNELRAYMFQSGVVAMPSPTADTRDLAAGTAGVLTLLLNPQGGSPLLGTLDASAVLQRALTLAELTTLYDVGHTRKMPAVALSASGAVDSDLSRNKPVGTLGWIDDDLPAHHTRIF